MIKSRLMRHPKVTGTKESLLRIELAKGLPMKGAVHGQGVTVQPGSLPDTVRVSLEANDGQTITWMLRQGPGHDLVHIKRPDGRGRARRMTAGEYPDVLNTGLTAVKVPFYMRWLLK
ncbi:MAG: hypothetical protein AB7P76_10115 [Candidatus Melainabacteria bacterium]